MHSNQSSELMTKAKLVLNKTFGYADFRFNQAEIIESILNQQDVLVLMPTGGGKSLCYQVPAMVFEGLTVVVSPLIALMQDQVDALAQVGISASFLNSTLSASQEQNVLAQIHAGETKLLYVAPERLVTPQFLNLLANINVSLFAIDEAHCVSQWGHDFRPEYQQLNILSQQFPNVPKVALTATADQRTREEIVTHLNFNHPKRFINSFDRPNIRYLIQESHNGREQMWRFISENHASDAGIVYCLSRKKVEAVAEWLTNKGRIALPYHAGLSKEERAQNQQQFLTQKSVIIVATIAFGMGIDKPDVRFVAHLSLPKSIEAYYQETGRAGRDGEPATVWMSYGLQDVILLRQMLAQSHGSEQFKQITQQKLDAMLGLCELTSCRRQTLLKYFNEDLAKPCGNCDNCLSPPKTWDASVAAQKALSCVFRTGQRFGIGYLIDVLKGKEDERIIKNHHHQQSTYGIGDDLSVAEWRSLFRQLVALEYVYVNPEKYGAIQLTEKSRALLKGKETLMARTFEAPAKLSKAKSKASKVSEINKPLFEALRALRRELADIQGVPPYVIFHDATLIEMSEKRPSRNDELQYISGVGSRKLEQYGKEFLAVIKANPIPESYCQDLSETVNHSLQLLNDGLTINEVAEKRELAIGTIYGHIDTAIQAGYLDLLEVLELEEDDYQLIVHALEVDDESEVGKIKRVYQVLGEAFDYGVIRCVANNR